MVKKIVIFLIGFFGITVGGSRTYITPSQTHVLILNTYRALLHKERVKKLLQINAWLNTWPEEVKQLPDYQKLIIASREEQEIDSALIALLQHTLELPDFIAMYWEQLYALLLDEVDGEEWQRMIASFSTKDPMSSAYDWMDQSSKGVVEFLQAIAHQKKYDNTSRELFTIARSSDCGINYPFIRIIHLLFIVSGQLSCDQLIREFMDLREDCYQDDRKYNSMHQQSSALLTSCIHTIDTALHFLTTYKNAAYRRALVEAISHNIVFDNCISQYSLNPILAAITYTFWLRLQSMLRRSLPKTVIEKMTCGR